MKIKRKRMTDEIKVVDLSEGEIEKEEIIVPEEPKAPVKPKPLPVLKDYEPPKEIKKQAIEKFNENENTKAYGVKAVSKRTITALWIFAISCLLILGVGIVWGNINFAKKDFSPVINNEVNPNVTAQFTEGADNNYIYNNYTVYNNFTILNNNTIIVRNTTA